MNKNYGLIFFAMIIFITMACGLGDFAKQRGDGLPVVINVDLTPDTTEGEPSAPPTQVIVNPEPNYQPVEPPSTATGAENSGPKEYSVTAVNYGCTCQVGGNMTVEFVFKDDKLEIPNGSGGSEVYEKIGEKTYKRSWMGYYILMSGEGDQATENKVDEERSVVIIFNNGGYVMEHYQGTAGSPCCIHTFTKTK